MLTTKEAAKRLGLNHKTLLSYIREGKIPAIKYSERKILIEEEEIQKFIENSRINNQ